MPANRAFDQAVEDVADGRPVDWDLLDSQATDAEERARLRWLRILNDVGELHRSTTDPSDPSDGGAGLDEDLSTTTEKQDGPTARTWGRFQLLQKVGEGSFGSVYRAWDPQLERELAIKILHRQFADEQLTARLLREGRALARIRHPNVVSVHAVESHADRVGLCMEFVRGETLDDVLRTQGKLSPRDTFAIGQDLCRALLAVHRAGFVHRDVKARNVMREEGGRIVLMDFGTGQDARTLEAFKGRTIAGTPLYMAPEVLDGEPATPASDLYGVGVLLFHLLTGEYPVNARSLDDLRESHRVGRSTSLSDLRRDVPRPFVIIIDRTLARVPGERYATANALLDDLTAAIERKPPASTRTAASRVTRLVNTVIVVVLMALVIGAVESFVFNSALDLSDFSSEGPRDWLVWALKSSVAPMILVVLGLLIMALCLVTRTVTLRLSTRAARLDAAARRWLLMQARRLGLDDVSVLASWLLLISGATLLMAWWHFYPLFDAFTTRITNGRAETLALLSPAFEEQQDTYRQTFSALLLLTVAAWYGVTRVAARTQQTLGHWYTAAAVLIIGLFLLADDLPYRVLLHNRFPVAAWNGSECYILGEKGDERLLLCPDLPPPRRRVVPLKDGDVRPLGRTENVYTKFAPVRAKAGA